MRAVHYKGDAYIFGVCYYPEHWPEAQWTTDARRMASLGLSVVRIGEFAWSRLEPEPGQLEFEWLDRAIGTLADAGLGVVLGTPTATPPKWLVDAYPGILPVDPATGRTRGFGSRRHYDFSSLDYRRESLRITAHLAQRYGRDPRVIGWQTDNEIGCHDTTLSVSPEARRAFQSWCEQRYGNVAALNAAWGNVFWSMEYRQFDEIEPPFGAVTETNPAHQLAYRRFASDQVIAFHDAMVTELRRHTDTQFITHNFIPVSDTGVDDYALAAPLDFPSYDSYPLGRTDEILYAHLPADEFQAFQRTGHPDLNALALDQTRALGSGGFWIMEQQPGPVNWATANPAPAPGMIRLWAFEAFAHGAECVSFFRWRQAPFAQEQMHAGLRLPDDRPSRRWSEFDECIQEILGLKLTSEATTHAAVALIVDPASDWITRIDQQSGDYDLDALTFQAYRAVRRLGLDVDIVSAAADLSSYSLVIAPCLAALGDDFVERAERSGATFVFGPRSGAKTSEFQIPATLAPGPLAAWVGATVTEVETVRPETVYSVEWLGQRYRAHGWREWLDDVAADVVARFDDGEPAIVRNGNAVYLTTLPSDDLWHAIVQSLCAERELPTTDLPPTLRLRRRGALTFAFNYDARAQALAISGNEVFLVGGPVLDARSVAVWRTTHQS